MNERKRKEGRKREKDTRQMEFIPLSGFGMRSSLASKNELETIPPANILKQTSPNGCMVFLMYFVEFTSDI